MKQGDSFHETLADTFFFPLIALIHNRNDCNYLFLNLIVFNFLAASLPGIAFALVNTS
ncbi:hypothetical protein STL3553_c04360 [Salmonella enterica subsp. enterica serovar Typhimurium str. L-3553]|uniref:Uncharacterized protein n=1 Tax=Salmonella typhimurium (strain 14028s / SGSC 2262) TaxID=588858 RepID=A0A0F6AXH8_SALT1|nr:hypothetical protein STM14_0430 [Salmonella enterica subsp. enterica serovar Typhimurium str. 14028S]AIE04302.1 hypothetical protein DC51_0387 [Salmonella enterica subsp. enterica serovar Typhimurium]AKD07043.1 hypothetical protein AX05_11120 [Salmonella enterica subsp. enterica serovar Typhimurium str. CDC 2011K-0870]EDZ16326.1 hypothetical protein SeI_A1232 [Salmonella enterica subsp. enterica serovar 4 [Salmonella enterica subsp. enterica serovar 4 [Salmonella enterica subsp. enterica sero